MTGQGKSSFWFDEVYEGKIRLGVFATETLFDAKSDFQNIQVFDTDLLGRVLVLDGIFMTSERDEHYYHEMLVHPAMTTAPQIRRVLVIGGGDGGTVREVLSYPEVERVDMVEIDNMVVEVSKRFLPSIGTAWDDPRLEVVYRDGIEYVDKTEPESYDVIFVDGSDPVGPAEGLFSVDFYKNCARLLSKDGVLALQSESLFLLHDIFLDIFRTLSSMFPRVHPYFGPVPLYGPGGWSWTYASHKTGPFEIIGDRALLAEKRCKQYNREIHRAAFAIPNQLKRIAKSVGIE